MSAILKGIAIGISIAAPVGPIGILCIRRTLNQGRLYGFASGMGAATADAAYGLVAALGLAAAGSFLTEQGSWLNVAGAAFLLYLAYSTARSAASGAEPSTRPGKGYWSAYLTTLLLTLTNPMTIVSFAGILAGLNLGDARGASAWFVAGVFAGSAAWWLALCLAVGASKKMLSAPAMKGINYLSAAVLAGFGLSHLFAAAL